MGKRVFTGGNERGKSFRNFHKFHVDVDVGDQTLIRFVFLLLFSF